MCSVEKPYNSLDPAVNAKLEELRRKIAKLEKEARELKRLKSDCDDAKKSEKCLLRKEPRAYLQLPSYHNFID